MVKKSRDQLIRDLIQTTIWRTSQVSEQPTIQLSRWSVMETQTGDHHLVGYNMRDREGRVSTAISGFNPATSEVTTRSGRVYQLYGSPGYDSDGTWVWQIWSSRNGLTGKDVTDQYIEKIAGAEL